MLRLQELRKEKQLSQSDTAKALGLNQQTYSRYERGERELGYDLLVKFATFFDVSIDYLLGNSIYFYPDAVGTEEERNILALFSEMTSAQKIRFIAYGEGLLGKIASENKN